MAEEKEQESTYLEKSGDALLPPISNGQLDHAQVRDLLDDTRSSSLSELEDGTDEVEMASANPVLARQLEADSEAETERLEISPHKNQIHNDIETETLPFTHSPSKLVESTVPQVPDNVPYSDSVVSSPGPSDEELENEMRPERSATSDDGDNNDEGVPDGSPRKRKHTDIEDDSSSNDEDETRRRRRRTQSVRSDVEEESELGLSREPTVEPLLDMPEGQDGLEGTSRTITNTPNILKPKASKAAKATHSKGKAPEILNNILEEGEDAEKPTQQVADEARPESDDEERAEGEDEDVEAVARDEEEYAKKMAAMESLAALEKQFATLRDRLYDERIVALNDELAQLAAPKPSHPEYLRQLECIRKYRDEKFETEQKLLVYKIKALRTKSVAHRSQIHSSYFQSVRDIREKHLDRIGERMSRVRRDHVKTDEKIPSYSIPFPTRRSTQITQQSSYNKEVSVLSGVAKYVGFPAAPTVNSALQAELDEDMEKMGILLNHVRNHKTAQSKFPRSTFSAMSRPAAEEQFLEQNPWANPQHPIHQRHMGRLSRQVSDQTQIADTVITPAAQKSLVDLNKPADSASTIPEHPSAQASSALNTPHSNHRSIRPQKSEGARTTGDQQRPLGFEKPQQQKERFQSVSPTEARKHTLAIYDPTPSKTNSTGPKDVELEEPPSHSYKMSRISLFGSPVRPDPLSRNGSSNAEMATGHATSSPITLHPHGRENHITPATGLSRIGAR